MIPFHTSSHVILVDLHQRELIDRDAGASLGSGWGGYRVLQSIDKRRYDVSVIAPTGIFSFTPLLAG
jgi:hypothetical protein